MANEFKVKKGLIVQGSGSTVLDIQGSQGQLFSVTDSLSGSLFSVNDISGMPIMEVFSDDRVNLGTFNAEAIKVSGSTANITGSLFGTSSYATQALSASWAPVQVSASFATTASYATQAATASWATNVTNNGVTSVSASGTVSGITLGGGPITSTGTLTLSGTISGLTNSNLSGTAGITNANLANPSLMIGSTNIALGATGSSLTGLSSVSATTFTGALTGNASTATSASYAATASFLNGSTTNAFIQNGNSFGTTALLGTNDNNSLALETNGSTKMFISSSGNVGIGTTSPSDKLDIAGGSIKLANGYKLYDGSTNDSTGLYWNSNQVNISGYSGIIFRSSNSQVASQTERMRITDAGNVGIGTSSPNTKLQVSALNSSYVNLTGGFSVVKMEEGYGMYMGVAGTGNSWIQSATYDNSTTYPLILNGAGGNVGIGTTSPGYKLDVNGSINSNSSGTGSLNLGYTTGSSQIAGRITGTHSPSYNSTGKLGFSVTTWGAGTDYGLTEVMAIDMRTADSKNPTIWMNPFGGNVGIGTTSPSYPLDVSGSIRTQTGYILGANSSADITIDGNIGSQLRYGTQKILFNSSDAKIYTANTARITVLNGGNVGIGETNPTQKFEVLGTSYFSTDIYVGADHGIFFSGNGAYNTGIYSSGNDFIFQTSGAEKIRLTSSGNLGIGITNPTYPLDVYNTGASTARIRVVGTSNFALFQAQNTSGTFYMGIDDSAGSGFAQGNYTRVLYSSNSYPLAITVNDAERMRIATNGAIKFNTYGSGTFTGTATQKLAVDSSGNIIELPIGAGPLDGSGTANYITKWTDSDTIGNSVMFESSSRIGIGTTSPATKLHVQGRNAIQIGDTAEYLKLESSDGYKTIYSYEDTTDANAGYGRLKFRTNGSKTTNLGAGGYEFIADSGSVDTSLMVVQNDGKVGIGATNPAWKLDVAGPTNATDYRATDVLYLTSDGDNTGANPIVFRHGPSGELARITSTGNVGIGTTVPQSKLEVRSSGAGNDGAVITLNRIGAWASAYSGLKLNTNDDGTDWWNVGMLATGNNTFNIGQNGGAMMSVLVNGNVGIGTTSPGTKLQVEGTGVASVGTINIKGSQAHLGLTTAAGTFKGWYGYFDSVTHGSDLDLNIKTGYEGASNIRIGANGDANHVFISGSGNVGIGTTNPGAGAKLHVVGNIYNSSGTFYTDTIAGYSTSNVNLAASTNLVVPSGNVTITGSLTATGAIKGSSIGMTNIVTGYVPYFNGSILDDSPVYTNGTNVGIGTTSTDQPLAFADSLGTKIQFNGNNSNGYQIGLASAVNSGDAMFKFTAGEVGAGEFGFYTTTNLRMLINNAGNVGIGTTSPGAKLQVDTGTSSGDGEGIRINRPVAGTHYHSLEFATAGTVDWSVGQNSNDSFEVYENGSAATTRLSIKEGGNVGIGTTTPNAKLDVNGNAIVTGSLTVTGRITAEEFHTEFVSSSIVYQSGSTKFGDTSDDVMSVTGSLRVNGSITGSLFGTASYATTALNVVNNGVTSVATNNGITGGTITSTGTIGLATAYGDTVNPYASKTANYVLAAPNGSAGVPSFRAIVAADIPTLNQNTSGNAATATSASYAATASYIGSLSANVTNNTNNNILTATGGSTINGESNLTFTGTLLRVSGSDDAASSGVLEIATSGGTNLKLGGNTAYSWIQSHAAKPLYINQLGNNVVLNSGGGNVLIGTTTDAGYNLYVNGTLRTDSNALLGYNTTIGSSSFAWGFPGTYYGQMQNVSSTVYGLGFGSTATAIGTTVLSYNTSGYVGIGTTTPQSILDVVTPANGYASFANQMSAGQYSGIHFGYRENNTNYRKSAIVFERTDLTSANAQGKVHILNGPQAGAGSATLSDAKLTIAEDGNVGIGTTSPASGNKLEVNGRVFTNQLQYTKAIDISSGNLNDYVTAGFYNGSGMTNAPDSGWFWVTVEKYSGDDNWAHQTATSFGASNTANIVYSRVKASGTWGSWKQLMDTAGTGASGTWGIDISGNASTATTAGATTAAVTFNNGGAGAASGTTFNGSTARTISYNTIGAQPLLTNPVTGTGVDNRVAVWSGTTTQDSDSNLTWNGTTFNVGGILTATVKSFIIDHPTKQGKKLQYGVLEGPEHSVYVRGKLTNNNTITLPDHWTGLVHEDTITVNLTPIGKRQDLWVETVTDTAITVGSDNEINCYYTVFAERKDIEKLVTEFDK